MHTIFTVSWKTATSSTPIADAQWKEYLEVINTHNVQAAITHLGIPNEAIRANSPGTLLQALKSLVGALNTGQFDRYRDSNDYQVCVAEVIKKTSDHPNNTPHFVLEDLSSVLEDAAVMKDFQAVVGVFVGPGVPDVSPATPADIIAYTKKLKRRRQADPSVCYKRAWTR